MKPSSRKRLESLAVAGSASMNIRPGIVAIGNGDALGAARPPARGQNGRQEVAAAGPNLPAWTSTQDIDRATRAGIARLTAGLAPSALAGAFLDWAVHLAASPGKLLELVGQAWTAAIENATFAAHCAVGLANDPSRCALPQDNRFHSSDWQSFPFNAYAHTFLSIER